MQIVLIALAVIVVLLLIWWFWIREDTKATVLYTSPEGTVELPTTTLEVEAGTPAEEVAAAVAEAGAEEFPEVELDPSKEPTQFQSALMVMSLYRSAGMWSPEFDTLPEGKIVNKLNVPLQSDPDFQAKFEAVLRKIAAITTPEEASPRAVALFDLGTPVAEPEYDDLYDVTVPEPNTPTTIEYFPEEEQPSPVDPPPALAAEPDCAPPKPKPLLPGTAPWTAPSSSFRRLGCLRLNRDPYTRMTYDAGTVDSPEECADLTRSFNFFGLKELDNGYRCLAGDDLSETSGAADSCDHPDSVQFYKNEVAARGGMSHIECSDRHVRNTGLWRMAPEPMTFRDCVSVARLRGLPYVALAHDNKGRSWCWGGTEYNRQTADDEDWMYCYKSEEKMPPGTFVSYYLSPPRKK